MASRYETADGKTINYTSENPEGDGGLFDFDFSNNVPGAKDVPSAGRDNRRQQSNPTLQRRNTALLASASDRLNKNASHSFEVANIELLTGQHGQPAGNPRNESNSINGTKLLKGVEKSYDKGKKLLDESDLATAAGDLRFREVDDDAVLTEFPDFGKAEYITDREIERINAHQREMAQTSPEAKSRQAEKLAQRFSTPIKIVADTNELTSDNAERQARLRKSNCRGG